MGNNNYFTHKKTANKSFTIVTEQVVKPELDISRKSAICVSFQCNKKLHGQELDAVCVYTLSLLLDYYN